MCVVSEGHQFGNRGYVMLHEIDAHNQQGVRVRFTDVNITDIVTLAVGAHPPEYGLCLVVGSVELRSDGD
jgi:hypothetical protein